MMLYKVIILNVEITFGNKEKLLEHIANFLNKRKADKPLTIFTPNPEQIVLAQKDGVFKKILNSADVALPDGAGVVWAINQSSVVSRQSSVVERIPGIEFMDELVRLAVEKGYPVGLIGGRAGVADKSLKVLKEKYPGLEGWAQDGPEVEVRSSQIAVHSRKKNVMNDEPRTTNTEVTDQYFENLTIQITTSVVRIVFVGLGAPKQEYFIKKLTTYNLQPTTPLVLMSVGGAFDFLSGRISRAPEIIRVLDLEWLWRLIREPWRIVRQIRLLKFLLLVFRERFMVKSS